MDDFSVNIRQTPVDSVVPNRQLRVIQSKLMQDRRMDIVDLRRSVAIAWLVSPLIALSMSDPPLDSSTA